jgi:hypothetical protein
MGDGLLVLGKGTSSRYRATVCSNQQTQTVHSKSMDVGKEWFARLSEPAPAV